jgi:hypothetical protein
MQKLLMPFGDESASYAYGFEVGILWQQMTQWQPKISQMVHQANYQQIVVMAMVHHYAIASVSHQDGGWVQLELRLKFWQRVRAKVGWMRLRSMFADEYREDGE